MNMSNITFKIPRSSTFVIKKSLEKKIFTIIFVVKSLNGFGCNTAGPASQTMAQHYFTIGSMYHVIRVVAFRGMKASPAGQSEPTRDNHPILFQWTSVGYDFDRIEPAMGCDVGSTLNRYWVVANIGCARYIDRIDAYTDLSVNVTVRSRVNETRDSTFHWQVLHRCWPAPAMLEVDVGGGRNRHTR